MKLDPPLLLHSTLYLISHGSTPIASKGPGHMGAVLLLFVKRRWRQTNHTFRVLHVFIRILIGSGQFYVVLGFNILEDCDINYYKYADIIHCTEFSDKDSGHLVYERLKKQQYIKVYNRINLIFFHVYNREANRIATRFKHNPKFFARIQRFSKTATRICAQPSYLN